MFLDNSLFGSILVRYLFDKRPGYFFETLLKMHLYACSVESKHIIVKIWVFQCYVHGTYVLQTYCDGNFEFQLPYWVYNQISMTSVLA